jgi:Fe2+ transport system protein FeoA
MKWRHRKCLCRDRSENEIRLSDAKAGIRAVVSAICSERIHRSRILGLGIQIGCTIEVLRNAYSKQGCMIIKVTGARLIINRKIAEKVIITTGN